MSAIFEMLPSMEQSVVFPNRHFFKGNGGHFRGCIEFRMRSICSERISDHQYGLNLVYSSAFTNSHASPRQTPTLVLVLHKYTSLSYITPTLISYMLFLSLPSLGVGWLTAGIPTSLLKGKESCMSYNCLISTSD